MVMVSRPESRFCRTMSLLMSFALVCYWLAVSTVIASQRVGARAPPDDKLREAIHFPSFRDGPKDQTEDVQLRVGESRDSGFASRPGMTAFGRHFFTSGQRDSSSDWNASLPGMVASSL